jgi:hypothetical protein
LKGEKAHARELMNPQMFRHHHGDHDDTRYATRADAIAFAKLSRPNATAAHSRGLLAFA